MPIPTLPSFMIRTLSPRVPLFVVLNIKPPVVPLPNLIPEIRAAIDASSPIVPAEVSKSIETVDPTVPSPFLNIKDLKFVADDPAIDNLDAGLVVPIPTLPVSLNVTKSVVAPAPLLEKRRSYPVPSPY